MTRILIVDDDADILELLRLEFEDDPCWNADGVMDPARALDMARTTRYDVIITDWRMPAMTGGELVRTLRKQGCTSYVIIYSGMDPDQDLFKALETDAEQYIFRRGNPEREFGELKESIRALSLPVHHRPS